MSDYTQRNLAKTLNNFMVFYDVIFVFTLVLLMLADPTAPMTFVLFMLLVPVLLFFAHSAWKKLAILRRRDARDWYFSWRAFFTQDNMMFFFTLVLFVLALNLALTRRAQSFSQLVFSSTQIIEEASATKGRP